MNIKPKTKLMLHSFCSGGNLLIALLACIESRWESLAIGLLFGIYSTVMMIKTYRDM